MAGGAPRTAAHSGRPRLSVAPRLRRLVRFGSTWNGTLMRCSDGCADRGAVCPRQDPEDVAADVIAKLWERADQFDPVCEPWPWIRRLPSMRRLTLAGTRRRADSRRCRVRQEDIEARLLDAEIFRVVRRVCRSLPEDERDALLGGFGRGRPRKSLMQVLIKIVAAVRAELGSDIPLAVIARHLHVVLEEFMERENEEQAKS